MSIGLLTSTIQAAKRIRDRANPMVQSVGSGIAAFIKPEDNYSYLEKKKTRLELIRLSAVVCGIELCYAAETAFVSPILLKLGVPAPLMSLVWCLSPFFGIVCVPVLGSLSDNCRLKFGRRRPFIVLLATGIVIGLIIVPNGKTFGIHLGDQSEVMIINETLANNNNNILDTLNTTTNPTLHQYVKKVNETVNETFLEEQDDISSHVYANHKTGIILTILGVVLLDFSCDAAQSPSRAYLLDVSIPEDHPKGLSTFTIMAGLGGCFGYIMGGINWDLKHTEESSLEGHIFVVFTAVTIFFILCLVITLTSFKEVPLSHFEKSVEEIQKSKKVKGKSKYEKFTNEEDDDSIEDGDENLKQSSTPVQYGSTDDFPNKKSQTENFPCEKDSNETIAKKPSSQSSNLISLLNEVKLKTYLVSIIRMPKSLFVLCVTNLFCWMSLVCYSLYFTDFVGQAVFRGDPKAPRLSHLHKLYNDGVRLGSFGMALYSLSCAFYSMFIEKLVEKFGAKWVYIGGQFVYCVGMIIMAATQSRVTVILLSPTAGIMYATLFTMPYMLVANYHTKGQFSAEPLTESSIRGLGTDLAIVSSMVFVAQFVLSAFVGSVVDAAGSTVAVVVVAAILSFLGALSATQVLYLDL
ncbi:proton-associated sugar transporter A-like [Saccostrea echinata]|uniref:proton-associated sugar transporter A-like n=1 Tax=Saccostrea echinata TaxID=191078 RepID=UPI002A836907|nr:proton-associated sugar transporter A-like [Saccostrea echinata]